MRKLKNIGGVFYFMSINWTKNKVLDQSTANPASQAHVPVVTQTDSSNIGTQEGPPSATEKGYIPYYLASNIGKNVRAEFIIGTNQYVDKTGLLTEVGINYFVLRDVNSRTDIMCDLYSVKFVTILRS
jgi:hypothetical protein